MYTRSVSPEQAPDKATYLDLEFEGGNPVAIDGQNLSPASLLTQLNKVNFLPTNLVTQGEALVYRTRQGQTRPPRLQQQQQQLQCLLSQ